jgi:hypothetical protein
MQIHFLLTLPCGAVPLDRGRRPRRPPFCPTERLESLSAFCQPEQCPDRTLTVREGTC